MTTFCKEWFVSGLYLQLASNLLRGQSPVDAEPGARGVDGLVAWGVGCRDLAMSAASPSVDSSVISAGGSPAGSETDLPIVCSDGRRGLTGSGTPIGATVGSGGGSAEPGAAAGEKSIEVVAIR